MSRRLAMSIAAVSAVLAFAAPRADAQTASDLVGAWTLVSATAQQGGARVDTFGPDPSGTLASPLETLERAKDKSDLDRLAQLVLEHEVTEVVVGEPRHLSGASGASARDADAYARELSGRTGDSRTDARSVELRLGRSEMDVIGHHLELRVRRRYF